MDRPQFIPLEEECGDKDIHLHYIQKYEDSRGIS